MSVWFEDSGHIDCDIEQVKRAFENHGQHYLEVVALMPGLKDVELVAQDSDSVTIKTNEGLMKRTNIVKRISDQKVVVEFDEEYQAGSMVTTNSHLLDQFTVSEAGVEHRMVVSDLAAPGFLGFFYRNFGRSSMGKAFLSSYKTYFETMRP